MDPNRYIASKIGLAREMSDMSITTLARRAGMTPNALSESLRVLPSFGIRVGGRHRSGSAMGAAPGADKRCLVRCTHKIGCLLRAGLEERDLSSSATPHPMPKVRVRYNSKNVNLTRGRFNACSIRYTATMSNLRNSSR